MVSLCIKTNNNTAIDYLMVNIAKINLDDIVFVKKNFFKTAVLKTGPDVLSLSEGQ